MAKIILAMMFLAACTAAFAQYTPFHFLRANASARGAALSGAVVSIIDDASLVNYNPAVIYTVTDKDLSVTFAKNVLDMNSGMTSYVNDQVLDDGVLGVNLNFNSYGSFDYADNMGNRNGQTFGGNDLSFGVTYANELDSNLYYGVTGKFIFLTLEEQSSVAFGVDAGILYKLKDGRTNFGASILHAGGQLSKLGTQSDKLPLDVRIGLNHRLKGLPLLINFNFHHLADETDKFFDKLLNFSIGGELYLGKYLQARVGYDNQVRKYVSPDSNKGLSGFSGGVGLKFESFILDYGLSQYGSAASIHRFSLGLGI